MSKFKFKPNKAEGNDGIGSKFTNEQRAYRGQKAVQVHPDSMRVRPSNTNPSDIIADIFHFCDKHGFDVDLVLASARDNWEQER
jgi:hypothetical protein